MKIHEHRETVTSPERASSETADRGFRAKCIAVLVCAFLCGISTTQGLKIKLGGILYTQSTNTCEVEFRVAGSSISVSGEDEHPPSTNCTAAFDADTTKVTLESGKEYTLWILHVTNPYCGWFDVDTLEQKTRAWFNLTNDCFDFKIAGVKTNVALSPHDDGSWDFTVIFQNDYGEIVFDPCGPLLADGQSIKKASLTHAFMFEEPISWSIEGDDLGCSIDGLGAGAVITAGTNVGSITVRATDNKGCWIENDLELTKGERDCKTCSEDDSSAPGEGDASLGSVHLEMFLGRTVEGASARSLVLGTHVPTNTMYTPEGLSYPWKADNVHVLRSNGIIRQVRAPQTLADVVVSNSYAYEVRFYNKTDMRPRDRYLYQLATGATPFTTWIIENPEPTTTNKLRITKSPANQNPTVYQYSWLTNGWELGNSTRQMA